MTPAVSDPSAQPASDLTFTGQPRASTGIVLSAAHLRLLLGADWASLAISILAPAKQPHWYLGNRHDYGYEYPLVLAPSLMLEGQATLGGISEQWQSEVPFGCWAQFPPATLVESTSAQQMVMEIQTWTGWSRRTIADVLGITHPTVGRMIEGDLPSRSGDAVVRLRHVHGIVQRLYVLVGRRRQQLKEVVSTPIAVEQDSVTDLLRKQDWVAAYRLGLRVLSGPEPDMLVSAPDASILDASRATDDPSTWV